MWSEILSNLYIQRMAFRFMGINLEALPQATIIQRLWLLLITCFSIIYQWSCVVVYIFMTKQTIAEATWTMLPWLQSTVSLLKTFTLLFKARDLIQLNAEVNGLLENEMVSFKARSNWLRANRRAQGYCVAYTGMVLFSAIAYLMMPIILTLVPFVMTGEFKPFSVMNTKTPYDQSQPLFFLLDYILLFWTVIIASSSTVAVDTLFFWYVTNISGHFRIVLQQIEELAEDFTSFKGKMNGNNKSTLTRFEGSCKGLMIYHKITLDLATKFAETFRVFILWEVLFNCLLFCSIVCQFLMSENLKEGLLFLIVFTITILSQLMIYCFSSEKLKGESEEIAVALYERLPWYEMPNRLQKLLLLIPPQRAQQKIILTGYIFRLERPLLVSIIRTAFSGATLLKALQQTQ